MIIGKIPNFSEYRLKRIASQSLNFINETIFNLYIHQNFPFALQSYRNQYNYGSITMRVNPHFHNHRDWQINKSSFAENWLGHKLIKAGMPNGFNSHLCDIHNEVLPLTLQSEIKQQQIISLIKGNC